MKILNLIHIITFLSGSYLYAEDFNELLAKGKAEFYKEFKEQDYRKAVDYLEKAVSLSPENPEARYFLGYAYSRVNSKDGNNIFEEQVALTLKASEEFETVIKLDPTYTGEIVSLDPYSKLSSEWGSLAMAYLHTQKPDSAIWAFQEGKKRGGFSEYTLSMNRLLLDMCGERAILMSSGDLFTISLWYLQHVEKYRQDVAVIDISLLHTTWYPIYLYKNNIISFGLSLQEIKDLEEIDTWEKRSFTIGNFAWNVTLPYNNMYILKGDKLFLSILEENNFSREVYFTVGFPPESYLGLTPYLDLQILSDKLEINKTENPISGFLEYAEKILACTEFINIYSQNERMMSDNLRYRILQKAETFVRENKIPEARILLNLLEKYPYPYLKTELYDYEEFLRIAMEDVTT